MSDHLRHHVTIAIDLIGTAARLLDLSRSEARSRLELLVESDTVRRDLEADVRDLDSLLVAVQALQSRTVGLLRRHPAEGGAR